MKKYFYNFLLMIQLLTRVPVDKELPCNNKNFKDGANFFWLIGFLIGLCQYILFIVLDKIISINFTIIAVIVFEILITGALHLDGFGDTCDGFFAFKGKDRIIEIMKDSRIGTFACIAIVLNILIKYEGYTILVNNSYTIGILIIPMVSRFSMVFLSFIGKAAKEKGSGNLFINTVTLREVLVNLVFVLSMGLLVHSIVATAVLLAVALVITVLFNVFCYHKISGITGDSLGANNELVMLFSLLILSSL